jgi:RHS repeat-associated protein
MIWFLTLVALLAAPHLASAYYDPGVQRWLNRDPVAEKGFELLRGGDGYGGAGAANLYAFAANDPADRIDALGLNPIEIIEILTPPDAGGSACPKCTPTGYTIYKSPAGKPVRRSCHYECSYLGGKTKRDVTVDVGPRTPCPSSQDIEIRVPISL